MESWVMDTEPFVLSWFVIWDILKIYNVQLKGGKLRERERCIYKYRNHMKSLIFQASSFVCQYCFQSMKLQSTIPFPQKHHNLQIWLPHEVPSGTVSALPIASLPVANRHWWMMFRHEENQDTTTACKKLCPSSGVVERVPLLQLTAELFWGLTPSFVSKHSTLS